MKKGIFLLLVSGLVSSLVLLNCRTPEEKPPVTEAVSVRTAAVLHTQMAEPIQTFGRVAAKKEMKLSFKTGGIIEGIYADEGQTVAKDQLLARLDPAEIKAQVKQAQSGFEKAQRDLKRVGSLYKDKAATLEQYQNARTALKVSRSRLETAEFNLRHSDIHAPVQGRIIKRLMEENEIAAPGMPVFLFASTENDWIVRAGISDRDLVRVQLNDSAVVKFDVYPDDTFTAKVTEIVQSADPRTGTYEIELKIDARDKRLVPGFIAEVLISPEMKQTYAVIPVEALVEAEGNEVVVFAMDETTMTARRLFIEIGFLFEDKAAVVSGLEDISTIVTEGASYLEDGTKLIRAEGAARENDNRMKRGQNDENI